MNIALIGYGKMGKTIAAMATQQNHNVACIINSKNELSDNEKKLKNADVAIEFTNPSNAFHNVSFLLKSGIPVVCGTTGWNEQIKEAEKICTEYNGSLLISSNFSIGVNIFFLINEYISKLFSRHKDYSIQIEETHHIEKKDNPSGTALMLAEKILQNRPDLNLEKIPIHSLRKDKVPGTHRITYENAIDRIELTHIAYNRNGFATGAIAAAYYIHNRKGIFSMNDVLQIL